MAVALALGLVGGSILAILSEQIRVPLEAYRQRLRLDRVTGVYNRRFMTQLIEEEIARDRDAVFSIGILELDHFLDLLATLSNATSQKILLRITDTLRKEFRGNDIIVFWL
jgi:diguanylate cyclase (GGDEF)-like protein